MGAAEAKAVAAAKVEELPDLRHQTARTTTRAQAPQQPRRMQQRSPPRRPREAAALTRSESASPSAAESVFQASGFWGANSSKSTKNQPPTSTHITWPSAGVTTIHLITHPGGGTGRGDYDGRARFFAAEAVASAWTTRPSSSW